MTQEIDPTTNYKKILIQTDPWSEEFKSSIRSSPHYKTILQWQENATIPLQQTLYYKWLMDIINETGTVWEGQLNNEQDVLSQCVKFKDMYSVAPKWDERDDVIRMVISKNNGLRYYFGPITVRINETGDIIVSDGNHRLACLLALDLPITVTICERHPKWVGVIDCVNRLYPEVLYQPFRHPEFSDRKCSRTGRTEQIVNDVVDKYNVKSILDLGCCHGETLYSLRGKIKTGIGVESDRDRFKLTSLLFSKIGFKCAHADIYDYVQKDVQRYDMILSLATFHHFMFYNAKERFLDLMSMVAKKTNMLMYELPEPHEPQYTWMYKDTNVHALIQGYFTTTEFFQKDRRKIFLLRR